MYVSKRNLGLPIMKMKLTVISALSEHGAIMNKWKVSRSATAHGTGFKEINVPSDVNPPHTSTTASIVPKTQNHRDPTHRVSARKEKKNKKRARAVINLNFFEPVVNVATTVF